MASRISCKTARGIVLSHDKYKQYYIKFFNAVTNNFSVYTVYDNTRYRLEPSSIGELCRGKKSLSVLLVKSFFFLRIMWKRRQTGAVYLSCVYSQLIAEKWIQTNKQTKTPQVFTLKSFLKCIRFWLFGGYRCLPTPAVINKHNGFSLNIFLFINADLCEKILAKSFTLERKPNECFVWM